MCSIGIPCGEGRLAVGEVRMRDAGLELELAITQDRCLTRLPRYWGAWNDGAGSVSSRRLRCWRRQRRPERICRRSRAGTDYCRPRCTSGAAWLSLGLGRRRNRVIVEATRHRDVDVVFRFAHDSPLEGGGFEPSVPPRTGRSGLASSVSWRRRSPASAGCCASTEKREKLYGLIATKGGSDDQGAPPQCLSLP